MTIKHLKSDHIDPIALGLNMDVYDGLSDTEIKARMIERINAATERRYEAGQIIPVAVVADLIRSAWEYMDRQQMDAVISITSQKPLPETLEEAVAARRRHH
jgi:hypothetical protein